MQSEEGTNYLESTSLKINVYYPFVLPFVVTFVTKPRVPLSKCDNRLELCILFSWREEMHDCVCYNTTGSE